MQSFEQFKTVNCEGFKALGPYSAGKVVSGNANTVYLSGQIGMIPQTGELVSQDVAEQTAQAMENIKTLLAASNSNFKNVIKCIVYLVDMADFPRVNEVYAKFFDGEYPARVCIAVHQLPKGAKVEVETIAIQNN